MAPNVRTGMKERRAVTPPASKDGIKRRVKIPIEIRISAGIGITTGNPYRADRLLCYTQ
jgi:hypothetical protein